MMEIIKLSQLDLAFVKNYLKIDFDDDDSELSLMIRAAQNYIYNNLNAPKDYLDEQPDLVIACLQIISHFYENKTAVVLTNTKMDMMLQNILIQYKEWL